MFCGPACIALIQGIPVGLVAATVGLIGARIARHQAAIAEAKLRLDLFEKRYPIFQRTWEIMSEAASHGTRAKNWGLGTPFNSFLPQARFLFGGDIAEYISEASDKWIDLDAIMAEREDPGARARSAEREKLLKRWFHDEASTGLKQRFGPCLNFERWT